MTQKQRNGLVFLLCGLLLAGGGGGAYWYLRARSDSAEAIAESAANLRAIWRTIREFQSEAYFAQPPKSMESLLHYRFVAYAPKPENEQASSATGPYDTLDREYSLIPDARMFYNKALGHAPDKAEFSPDYTLLSWYEMFMPDNVVIAWDNPGNFTGGGNLLFYNGRVQFVKATPSGYQRLIKALQTKTDRDFVKRQCRDAFITGFTDSRAD